MNENLNRSRHDKGERRAGEKVGGRFKKSRASEASGAGLLTAPSLTPEEFKQLSPEQRRQHREAQARDRYASLTPEERRARNEEYRALNAKVRIMHNMSWKNHDRVLGAREDIRQEAMVRIFIKGEGEGLENLATDHIGLTRTMLSQEVLKIMNNGQSSRESSGRQKLYQRKRELEHELGRRLNKGELEKLADEVRLSFPPGMRPKPGYQENPHAEINLTFNEDEPETGDRDMRRYISYDQRYSIEEETPEAGDAFARAQERLDARHEKRSDLRQNLWSVMREANPELPELSPSSHMPPAKARRTLSGVPDGAYGAADRFLNGESTRAEEAAMFAPWGGPQAMTAGQQKAVAEKLAGNMQFAGRIWDSALSSSTRQEAAPQQADEPEIDAF